MKWADVNKISWINKVQNKKVKEIIIFSLFGKFRMVKAKAYRVIRLFIFEYQKQTEFVFRVKGMSKTLQILYNRSSDTFSIYNLN